MPAPVNVKLQTPTVKIPDWTQQAREWMKFDADAGGNRDFYPLTVKAAYVMGVEHDICESVSHLLAHLKAKETTYIPAYGVFASGVELLGRYIRGNSTTGSTTADLKTGFKWLVSSSYDTVPDTHVLITTRSCDFTVDMLAALRHFAAHGQATSKRTPAGTYGFGVIDYGILSQMPHLIADGLERYWSQLLGDDDLCNKLAKANIIRLRSWPVLSTWLRLARDRSGRYHSVSEIFNRFDWQV